MRLLTLWHLAYLLRRVRRARDRLNADIAHLEAFAERHRIGRFGA